MENKGVLWLGQKISNQAWRARRQQIKKKDKWRTSSIPLFLSVQWLMHQIHHIKYKLWQVPQELRKRRNNDVFFLEVVFMWNSKDEVHFWLLTCFFHTLCKNPLEFSVRFHWSSPSDLLQFSHLITGTIWGNFTIFPYSEERLKQKGNTNFCGHRLVRVKGFWHFQY